MMHMVVRERSAFLSNYEVTKRAEKITNKRQVTRRRFGCELKGMDGVTIRVQFGGCKLAPLSKAKFKWQQSNKEETPVPFSYW